MHWEVCERSEVCETAVSLYQWMEDPCLVMGLAQPWVGVVVGGEYLETVQEDDD